MSRWDDWMIYAWFFLLGFLVMGVIMWVSYEAIYDINYLRIECEQSLPRDVSCKMIFVEDVNAN